MEQNCAWVGWPIMNSEGFPTFLSLWGSLSHPWGERGEPSAVLLESQTLSRVLTVRMPCLRTSQRKDEGGHWVSLSQVDAMDLPS